MPFAVASQISPSGMTLAGKHGIGIISVGSTSTEGLTALPMQWSFAEEAAAKHGQVVDRKNWRVVLSRHIAEASDTAATPASRALMRMHNKYIVRTLHRPAVQPLQSDETGGDTQTGKPEADEQRDTEQ